MPLVSSARPSTSVCNDNVKNRPIQYVGSGNAVPEPLRESLRVIRLARFRTSGESQWFKSPCTRPFLVRGNRSNLGEVRVRKRLAPAGRKRYAKQGLMSAPEFLFRISLPAEKGEKHLKSCQFDIDRQSRFGYGKFSVIFDSANPFSLTTQIFPGENHR